MDEKDKDLLLLLQKNSNMSYSELGKKIGLSVSAVNERIKKLETSGAIKGYSAIIDPVIVGVDLCVFIQVLIDKSENEINFLSKIHDFSEIQECHHISGEYSYILKVRVKNTQHMESFLKEKLKLLPGIIRTYSTVVFSTAKETTFIDLSEE